MDYIVLIDAVEPDDDEDDFICDDCMEREMEEMLHQDIATASDMPIEIVKRVLRGQSEVLGMDE